MLGAVKYQHTDVEKTTYSNTEKFAFAGLAALATITYFATRYFATTEEASPQEDLFTGLVEIDNISALKKPVEIMATSIVPAFSANVIGMPMLVTDMTDQIAEIASDAAKGFRRLLTSSAACSSEDQTMYNPSSSYVIPSVNVEALDVALLSGKLLSVVANPTDRHLHITSSNPDGSSPITRAITSGPLLPTLSYREPEIMKSATLSKSAVIYSGYSVIGSDSRAYVTVVNSDGTQSSAPVYLGFSSSGAFPYKPTICQKSDGGWATARVSFNSIELALVGSNGALGTTHSITGLSDATLARSCSIKQVGSGYILMYEDDGQIHTVSLNSDLTVSNSAYLPTYFGTLHDSIDHSSGVTWVAYKDATGLHAFTLSSSGTKSTVQDLCSYSDITKIQLTESSTGDVAVTFTYMEGGEENVAVRLCSASAVPIGGDFQVSNSAGDQSVAASIFSGTSLISAYGNGGTLTALEHVPNTAPSIDNPLTTVETTVGSSLSFSIPGSTASDLEQSITYEVRNLPGWASFDGTTIKGVPPAGTSETTYTLTLAVLDGVTETTQSFDLNVNNVAPQFDISILDQHAEVGSFFNFTLPENSVSNNDPSQTVTLDLQLAGGGTPPAWLNFDGASITGNPPAGSSSTSLSLQLVASDGVETTPQVFSLFIDNVAPQFVTPPLNQTLPALVPFTLPISPVTNNDPSQTVTLGVEFANGDSLPSAWASFDGTDFIATPPATGLYDFRVTANDGVTSVFAPFSYNVTNVPPVVTSPPISQSVTALVPLDIPFGTVTDDDIGQVVTQTVKMADSSSLPSWIVSTTTKVTVTPPADVVGSAINLVYEVGDGITVQSYPFSLSVTNTAPIISDAPINQTGYVGEQFTYEPGTTMTDSDAGQAVTTGISGRPEWLSWDGTELRGLPPLEAAGTTIPLAFFANDGVTQIESPFSIEIPDRPPIFPAEFQKLNLTGTDDSFSYNPPQATDPDGHSIVYSLGAGAPTSLVIDPDTGGMAGKIAAGNYSFPYIATANMQSVSLPMSLNIEEAPQSPVTDLDEPDPGIPIAAQISIAFTVISFVLCGGGKPFMKSCVAKSKRKELKRSIVNTCFGGRIAQCLKIDWCVGFLLDANGGKENDLSQLDTRAPGVVSMVDLTEHGDSSPSASPRKELNFGEEERS